MGFSAICFAYEDLLIRKNSGKSGKTVQLPFKFELKKKTKWSAIQVTSGQLYR